MCFVNVPLWTHANQQIISGVSETVESSHSSFHVVTGMSSSFLPDPIDPPIVTLKV